MLKYVRPPGGRVAQPHVHYISGPHMAGKAGRALILLCRCSMALTQSVGGYRLRLSKR